MSEHYSASDYVANITNLVSLPEACQRVNELIELPSTNAQILAEAVSLDPALAAMLLKVTNSAFFGFKQSIGTVSHAISIIGKNELRSIVLSAGAVDAMANLTTEFIEMSQFWHHSILTGLLARSIAPYIDCNKEELFIIGLLHDIGKLAIFHQSPDVARVIVEQSTNSEHWVQLENSLLGFSHSDIGFQLARQWKLPKIFCECIMLHHSPLSFGESPMQHVVYIANELASYLDNTPPNLTLEQLHTKLDISLSGLSLEDLKQAIELANSQSFEVMETIYPGSTAIY
ncbi:MAG: HDOD domain-containing protein [Methylococcales bacterium]|jgi:putative nucleotidyltransferase with HDIG domain|nr:HDOD domain-containing protein [Methylococcales bacterium]MBT7444390.1 HDOD domain-containing protein [Methylococcales bacterium]